jgi:hypothetical protein
MRKPNKKKIYTSIASFINEKAIDLDDLPFGSYLRPANTNKLEEKKFSNDVNKLKAMIENLTWHDIDFFTVLDMPTEDEQGNNIHTMDFDVILPDYILEYFENMEKKYSREKMQPFKKLNSSVQVERHNFNRLHIPAGVAEPLRGLGLGFNIYRAIIEKLKYASSERLEASESAKKLWLSIISKKNMVAAGEEIDTDLHVVAGVDRVMVMIKSLPDNEKKSLFAEWVKDFVNEDEHHSMGIRTDKALEELVKEDFPHLFELDADLAKHVSLSSKAVPGPIKLGDLIVSNNVIKNLDDSADVNKYLYRVVGKDVEKRFAIVKLSEEDNFKAKQQLLDISLVNNRYTRFEADPKDYTDLEKFITVDKVAFVKMYPNNILKGVKAKAIYVSKGTFYFDVYPYFNSYNKNLIDITLGSELKGPFNLGVLTPATFKVGDTVICKYETGMHRRNMIGKLISEGESNQESTIEFPNGKQIDLSNDLVVRLKQI